MSVRAYLELARLSNAPTVMSNALVGGAVAAMAAPAPYAGDISWARTLLAGVAAVLLYTAGMALNDLLDVEVDRRERPGRPIPSGRVSRGGAVIFIALCTAVALLGLWRLGWPAFVGGLLLVACIVAYDVLHRVTAASVILMGACRALVYVVAALAARLPWSTADGGLHPGWPTLAVLGATLAGYVIALSVVARIEMRPDAGARRGAALVLPVIVLIPLLVLRPDEWLLTLAIGLGLMLWLQRSTMHLLRDPPRIPAAIMGWIAGIALLDGFVISLVRIDGTDRLVAVATAVLCFVATVLAQRRIAGS